MKILIPLVVLLVFEKCYSQIDTTSYKRFNDSVFAVGDRILIRNVHFTLNGGGRIQDYSRPILFRVADFLKSHPNMIVEIAQFTDFRGNDQSNIELSKRRAQGICDFLVHQCDVNSKQLISKGYGFAEPIIPDEVILAETEHSEIERLHAINRRVELRVMGFLDDCLDFESHKRSCFYLNWPIISRHNFSPNDENLMLISCACELRGFQVTIFNTKGEVTHQQDLILQSNTESYSTFVHGFEIPLQELDDGTYVYVISKKGPPREEVELFQGYFQVYFEK